MIKKDKNRVCAIILAAGCGSRMGGSITKQRMSILGESVLSRSVRNFCDCDVIDDVVVVCRADEMDWVAEELNDFQKVCAIVPGGKSRAESASIGFSAIPYDTDYVAIHDAARCLVTRENIEAVVRMAFIHRAATASAPVTDTIKGLNSDGLIEGTVDRSKLVYAQTPQVFERNIYSSALMLAAGMKNLDAATDDNMIVEHYGCKIYPVDTGKHNIKITTAEDIAYAEFILERRRHMDEIRIGHGYDVHKLVPDRKLILGGVDIPFRMGLLGHSDADVLLHAIMDALLGACALGDIGRHFPDTDEKYRGISSLELLRSVSDLISNNGYSVINIDATLVIQKPKIAPYIDEMVNNISNILHIEQSRINIKATTEEGLGFTGCSDGVSAHAVAMIKK